LTSSDAEIFDVVVLDINMPIMDGFEACKRIHAYFNSIDYQKESEIIGLV
jgi:CheY-like chemotaxis protein